MTDERNEGDVPYSGRVLVCSKCGHRWIARKGNGLPKNCPSCRSTIWMKGYHRCRCLRCGYEWGSTSETPKRCPKCHTTKWAVPLEDDAPLPKAPTGPRGRTMSRAQAEKATSMYRDGGTVTEIAITLGVPFGEVYDELRRSQPADRLRVRRPLPGNIEIRSPGYERRCLTRGTGSATSAGSASTPTTTGSAPFRGRSFTGSRAAGGTAPDRARTAPMQT